LSVPALVITGVAAAIVIVSGDDPSPDAFEAVTDTVAVPPDAGVPDINPTELTVKPDGREVAPNELGLLLAVI